MVRPINASSLYITGLSHAYPEHSYGPKEFEDVVKRLYPQYATSPGLQKLIYVGSKTQIQSRRTISNFSAWTNKDVTPPTIDELSHIFRGVGVDLAVSACTQAMQEACLTPADITHTVAVTCTDQGNPGYDLLVCKKLQLNPGVQRVLLHGVGCAGGLSALRSAANIIAAESQRGRLARVLVMACELCSLFLKAELQAASSDDALHIAPALFSDAAAAVVLCNGLALTAQQTPVYELQEWGSMMVPNTMDQMSYEVQSNGMIATMTKDVPKTAVSAITPMFAHLSSAASSSHKSRARARPSAPDSFDWALHPGGAAILQGAKQALHLTDDHIRASLAIYSAYGNSSSPTVLIVLDQLRRMGKGRDDVVATSFGPGMMIEMCLLKRCRGIESVPPPSSRLARNYRLWLALQSRVARVARWSGMVHRQGGVKHGKDTILL